VTAILFAVFAGLGAFIRWKATARWGTLGTLILNLAGALGLGLMTGLNSATVTVLGAAGIGAMTTVSGLAREVHTLGSVSKIRGALYLAGTLVTGVGLAWVGIHWSL